MKIIFVFAAMILLSACSTVLPTPGSSNSLVLFSTDHNYSLHASKLNGERVENGQFFLVPAGRNNLEVLVIGGQVRTLQ